LDSDAPFHRIDRIFDDGQANAEAGDFTDVCASEEWLKDALLIFRKDAQTLIFYQDDNLLGS
jgi:hypothetical protein